MQDSISLDVSRIDQRRNLMLDHFIALIISQYLAALKTLEHCTLRCPREQWSGNVANKPFSQTAFHTLFFADLYLGNSIEEMKSQAFHQDREEFWGYEELEKLPSTKTYSQDFIEEYGVFCAAKVRSVLENETEASLQSESGIPWQEISRAELHTYNIRHIQHHAAQLILRLRLDSDVDVPWVKTS